MVLTTGRIVAAFQAAGLFSLVFLSGGCQSGPSVSTQRLVEHQALIDFSGLRKDEAISSVKTSIAAPLTWDRLPTKSGSFYTHEQWRAPSGHTGVGVVYSHLPWPLSAKTVVWLAKKEYSKKSEDGKIIAEWVDPLGRTWFEAENLKYHVRGYAVVEGFSAWVVYFGYRTKYPLSLGEVNLAARSAETAVPMLVETSAPATRPSFSDD